MVAKIEHKRRTGCPVACSLDVIGDHWTLLIIRNLMFSGVHEYKDMLKSEELISSSLLSARLKEMEKNGLIGSVPHPESKRRKLYFLKPMGKDLIYLMVDMVLWAMKYLNEFLAIPKEKMDLLQNNPDAFIKITLEQIEAWEKVHLS
jgi:DNA-binding HxlR family transcriptional regulator